MREFLEGLISIIVLALGTCSNYVVDTTRSYNYFETCQYEEFFLGFAQKTCLIDSSSSDKISTYILYDVNPVEGFNLRRDVFIRIVVWIKKLKLTESLGNHEFTLVLPPFSNLYHWRSWDVDQSKLFWRIFFDLESVRMYTNRILDFDEFFDELKCKFKIENSQIVLDEVYQLQHFENMFENGVYKEKFEQIACPKTNQRKLSMNRYYFGYKNMTANKLVCLQFQGSASLLSNVLEKYEFSENKNEKRRIRTVLFLNAETALHDNWGSSDYWQARRSMRFNKYLYEKANEYIFGILKEGNIEKENLQLSLSWWEEKEYRDALGSDYLCAHLRRGDFLHGRERTTPTLRSAAQQIKAKLKEFNLNKIFLSSDCTGNEYNDFKSFLGNYKLYRFTPKLLNSPKKLTDGEIAIIDQIICSHARYFIGTFESTFTYRIYEEREILGFPVTNTFNTFCKNDNLVDCEKNSVWPIVY